MRINQAYSPELQKDLREIKQRLENLDRGGGVVTGRVITAGSRPRPIDAKPIAEQPAALAELEAGTVNGDLYINGTLLVNGSEPLYVLDPTVTDYCAAGRAIGTIYQNTNDTMLDVRVSVVMA